MLLWQKQKIPSPQTHTPTQHLTHELRCTHATPTGHRQDTDRVEHGFTL